MGKLGVYRIEYDILRGGSQGETQEWTAYVGAYDVEEATKHLAALISSKNITIRVKTVGFECRLDSITDPLRNKIVEGTKRKVGRPKKK